MNQATLLADTLDFTRNLNKWYLSLLKETDMKQRFEVNGIQLNSAIWIVAHLTWAENFLVLQSTGGEADTTEWLTHFQLGSSYRIDMLPDTKEVIQTMKRIHEKSLFHIQSLTDAQLDEPTLTGVSFGADTKRRVIQHAIRHEGTHSGHLGWLCKLQGIKAI